jgi:hypothetical protein
LALESERIFTDDMAFQAPAWPSVLHIY